MYLVEDLSKQSTDMLHNLAAYATAMVDY